MARDSAEQIVADIAEAADLVLDVFERAVPVLRDAIDRVIALAPELRELDSKVDELEAAFGKGPAQ
jgi:propanediol dehydratase large subunit